MVDRSRRRGLPSRRRSVFNADLAREFANDLVGVMELPFEFGHDRHELGQRPSRSRRGSHS